MTSPPHNGYRKGLPFQRWPDTCEGQCDLNTHRLHKEFTFLKVPVKVSVTQHTRATGRVHVLKATCQSQCDPTTHGLQEEFTFLKLPVKVSVTPPHTGYGKSSLSFAGGPRHANASASSLNARSPPTLTAQGLSFSIIANPAPDSFTYTLFHNNATSSGTTATTQVSHSHPAAF